VSKVTTMEDGEGVEKFFEGCLIERRIGTNGDRAV
jgi:hypothetical protein